jgi:hypothetical protein
MRRVNVAALAATFALGVLAVFASPARAQTGVTVFEGARLIVGDGGAPMENATLLVDGALIVAAGRAADVNVPPGATRVSLAGKTVMPMLIDTHVHLSPTREAIMRDLQQRAYFGVSAALSLGMDNYELLDIRGQTIPGSARFFSAGRGITMPEPGRLTVPYWINTEAEGRKAVQELAGHKVDIVKIWVDTRDGKYKKLTPEIYGAIIDEAHKQGLRITAHIFDLEDTKGLVRAGIDAFAHGVRDRDIDDELVAMFRASNLVLAELAGPRRQDGPDLAAGQPPGADLEKLEAANTDKPREQPTASRPATWRSSTRRASASRSAPTATGRGDRMRRWPTW